MPHITPRRRQMISRLLVALALCFVVEAANAESSKGSAIASAIKQLIDADDEMNLDDVGNALQMPGLAARIRWSGPASKTDLNRSFRAHTQPAASPLQIIDISAAWLPNRNIGVRTLLTLEIESSACPTPEELIGAVGGKALAVRSPAQELWLQVPTKQEDSIVTVRMLHGLGGTVNGMSICSIYIERRPTEWQVVQPLD